MPDRVASDHDAVETVRATLERVGRTDRRRVAVPADAGAGLTPETVVRLVLDSTTYHTLVETSLEGDLELRGAFDSPTLARDPESGTDHLPAWVADAGVEVGGSVLLDVVTAEFKYGLRAPGRRVIYEATAAPDKGLSAIARDIEE